MPRTSLRLALCACVPLAAAAALAADAVKLRPLVAIYVYGESSGLKDPQGVACSTGELVVADSGRGRILAFTVSTDAVRPKSEFQIQQIPYPIRVGLLSNGNVLALDGKSRRIGRVTSSGSFEGWLEPKVDGPFAPRSFAVGDGDAVSVLDVAGWRVLTLDLGGEVKRSVELPKDGRFFSDIAVDGRGGLYVVDSVGRRVYVARAADKEFTPVGEALTEDVDFPTALAVDDEGRVFVADENGNGLVILDNNGTFRGRQLQTGWKDGFLRYPAGICLDGQGSLFIAERGNQRVQMFSVR